MRRSSGSSTGSSRSASSRCDPHRRSSPGGWRWSPAARRVSGGAIAERLAHEGASVVIADLDGERAEKVAAAIGAERALAVEVDVGDETAVAAAFADAALRFGGVDLVVNNAGFASSAELVDTTVDDWDRLHAVLARGSFLVSREAARMMMASGTGGDIVYVVSKNAVSAGPANVAYGAAKADQAHQVRLLAAELGRHGIRVNGVNPDGVVEGSGIFSSAWRDAAGGRARRGPRPARRVLREPYAARRGGVAARMSPTPSSRSPAATSPGPPACSCPVDGGVAAAFLR